MPEQPPREVNSAPSPDGLKRGNSSQAGVGMAIVIAVAAVSASLLAYVAWRWL